MTRVEALIEIISRKGGCEFCSTLCCTKFTCSITFKSRIHILK